MENIDTKTIIIIWLLSIIIIGGIYLYYTESYINSLESLIESNLMCGINKEV